VQHLAVLPKLLLIESMLVDAQNTRPPQIPLFPGLQQMADFKMMRIDEMVTPAST
jgi:hypothetical protein